MSREALKQVRARMAEACQRSGRSPEAVQLIMVSKTVPLERLKTYLDATAPVIFGENKAQAPELAAHPGAPAWHFIGALQSNKIKDILPYTDLLHSMDRFSLAEKLHKKLTAQGRRLPVLIQVNAAREDTKSGVMPGEALELIQRVAELDTLHIQGLMTIGANTSHEPTVRDSFKRLAELRHQARELALPDPSLPHLSMGMSGDFEWAIEEGATLVRVGSAIFGARH